MKKWIFGIALGLLLICDVDRVHLQAAPIEAVNPKLTIPANVQASFNGATRVEVLRLVAFDEEITSAERERMHLRKSSLTMFHGSVVMGMGADQNRAFAVKLASALSQADNPALSGLTKCFDPGVGFRVWKGKEHIDICICFYCSGVEIAMIDGNGKSLWNSMGGLGAAREPLLALSKKAFPQDERLQALKP